MKKLIIPFLENTHDWHKLKSMNDFSYPWKKITPPQTHFTAFHDKDHLYFKFYAEGPQPIVFRKDNHKLEVTKSERVEIFFTKDLSLDPYYCFEIDPLGRVLDYEARHYRIFDRKWKWPGDLQIETEIKDAFYTVSGRFEKRILSEFGLLQNNQLYADSIGAIVCLLMEI